MGDMDPMERRQQRYAERERRIEASAFAASWDPDAEFTIGDPWVETAAMIAAARARNRARGIVRYDPVAEAENLLGGGDV